MIKLTRADVSRLQWSLFLAIGLAAAGAFMVLFSIEALQATERTATQTRSEREAALRQRLHAREEAETIRANIATFHNLQTRGVLGQERRLDWVERLNAIRDARRLPSLRYELAPQIHGSSDAAASGIMISPMKATFGLLHEQDLIGFLDDLQTTVPAIVRTRHCHIARSNPSDTTTNGALLSAECDLDWITLKDPS